MINNVRNNHIRKRSFGVRVEVISAAIDGRGGYDVRISDNSATIQDYLDALNEFIEEAAMDRLRNIEEVLDTCRACHNCCQERIPLTSIDVARLSGYIPVQELFSRHIKISVSGRSVDITLKLGPDGLCKLNQKEDRLCGYYGIRPLVCQTYICCLSSQPARLLRESIVNAGEDQLVLEWMRMLEKQEIELHIDEAEDFDIREEDWQPTAYEGKKNYSEVLLKDLCSTELWEKLKGVRL